MNSISPVTFETTSRVHMGLAVKDVEQSKAFYSTLFGVSPTKTRLRYARFEVAEPPLNLSLNEVGGETGPINSVAHFGIQLKSTAAATQFAERLEAVGLKLRTEENVTCCFAVQNKVWVTDPDGNNWEIYVVLDDNSDRHRSSQSSCCSGVPKVMRALDQGNLDEALAEFQSAGGMSACSCLTETSE